VARLLDPFHPGLGVAPEQLRLVPVVHHRLGPHAADQHDGHPEPIDRPPDLPEVDAGGVSRWRFRLGLPVPGGQVRLFLPDGIFTHFEREEEIETLRGKFEDELVRIHDILDRATSDSVLIMNESFGSTTLRDALLVGTAVVRQIADLEALCVFVTFVDELASLSESTVSMMSTVVPEDPAVRTYKVVRKPADGLAYAAAIADKYRLSYEALRERIAR